MKSTKSDSAKQASNKNNAAKSTGPKTEEGKQAVAFNGVVHGLRSLKPVLPWLETEKDWHAHRDLIVAELHPVSAVETALADRIALAIWRLARSVEIQPSILSAAREKHRYRAIERYLRAEKLHKYGESAETTLIRLISERDHLASVASVWRDVLGKKKTPIPRELLADEIFDSVCPSEKWSDLEEPFNERFDWPPKTASDLRAMIDWLIEKLEEDIAFTIEQIAEAADNRAQAMHERIERIEKAGNRAADLAFVQSGELENMQRYETSIHRALLKDLHELQRLQAVRKGFSVAAPVAIDLTQDS